MLEKEMSKWDGYYRHYQYHVSRNPNYTVTRFIYVHFIDRKHNRWLENRHKSVPFNTRTQNVAQVLYFNKTIFSKEIPEQIIRTEKIFYREKAPAEGFLTRIIKPPCC